MKRSLGLIVAFVAALWLTTGTARAVAPTIVQAANCSVVATACTITLGSNVASGNAIYVIMDGFNNAGGSPSFSQCTYNGSNMTVGYDSGLQGHVYGVGLYAASVASVNSAICTFVNSTTTGGVMAEVSGSTLIPNAWPAAVCTTINCAVSKAHSFLTSGSRAIGHFNYEGAPSFACGTGWNTLSTLACEGTDTSANTISSQGNGTNGGAFVVFADICPTGGCGGGGGTVFPLSPKANAYPGGVSEAKRLREPGDKVFELLAGIAA